ncbi:MULTISPECIES: hypothetical protein [Thalassospira]|uniref:hypothetical protein n=1 Tax=Thalassospira TaxID=168934 RepID=UPI0008DE8E01|nr:MULTISPECIES: hypothetical protein [Thalassospira]MDM7975402.1 hypothetical protein [Thalassospira xiamenensis]OHZ00829.1 hypothetical protein BC440_08215 [Thalassospira sp. MIT1004]
MTTFAEHEAAEIERFRDYLNTLTSIVNEASDVFSKADGYFTADDFDGQLKAISTAKLEFKRSLKLGSLKKLEEDLYADLSNCLSPIRGPWLDGRERAELFLSDDYRFGAAFIKLCIADARRRLSAYEQKPSDFLANGA